MDEGGRASGARGSLSQPPTPRLRACRKKRDRWKMPRAGKTQLSLEDPLIPPIIKWKLAYLENLSQNKSRFRKAGKSQVLLCQRSRELVLENQPATHLSGWALLKNGGKTFPEPRRPNYPHVLSWHHTEHTWSLVTHLCGCMKARRLRSNPGSAMSVVTLSN